MLLILGFWQLSIFSVQCPVKIGLKSSALLKFYKKKKKLKVNTEPVCQKG